MADRKAFDVQAGQQIAEVTLLGPGKHNAMGPDFWRELPEVFRELDADPEVRAIVLAASGRNFSVGLELAEMTHVFDPVLADRALAKPRTALHRVILDIQESMNAVAECTKPVAAAIQGACIGGGVDLISAADIRYASADAEFSVREVRVAIVADAGSLQRLPAIIGDGALRELAFTGKEITAARAEQIGLVNEVLPDAGSTLRAARATAEIAANPPLVVQGIKEVLARPRAGEIADGLRYVAAWNSAFLPSEDLSEALSAVFNHRTPKFSGD